MKSIKAVIRVSCLVIRENHWWRPGSLQKSGSFKRETSAGRQRDNIGAASDVSPKSVQFSVAIDTRTQPSKSCEPPTRRGDRGVAPCLTFPAGGEAQQAATGDCRNCREQDSSARSWRALCWRPGRRSRRRQSRRWRAPACGCGRGSIGTEPAGESDCRDRQLLLLILY